MNICPNCGFENDDTLFFCGKCGTRLEEGKDPFIGTVIDRRYEVLEKIAEGGMGAVYRARDTRLDHDIAIKILHPELARDKKLYARFENEAKTVAKLRHDNIALVYDTGPVRDTYYIAMDFVNGEDLVDMIERKGRLQVDEAFSIASQVAEGLAYAHGRGILHRDIKPANIIVDTAGRAVITDFGIAKAIGEKGQTTTGTSVGTPEYMSLEQIKGDELDGRTDIYSLGVVLYEMLTGRSPFRSSSGISAIATILSEDAEPIEDIRFDLPEWAVDVVNKLMAKNRDDRFGSTREFIEAVNEGSGGTFSHIPVTSAPDVVKKSEAAAPKSQGDPTKIAMSKAEKILIFIVILATLSTVIFITVIGMRQSPSYRLHKGLSYANKGNMLKAIECYTEAIKLDPNYALAYCNRGLVYHHLGKNEKGVEDCTKAISLEPKNPLLYYKRIKIYEKLEKYEEAIGDYSKIIDLDPNDEWAYYHRGYAYSKLRKYKEALKDYTKAIDLKTNEKWFYYNRGYAYDALRKYKEAVKDYTKAIDLDTNFKWPYHGRGWTYIHLRKREEAVEDFTKAIELDPTFTEAFFSRGYAYLDLRKYKEAVEDYNKVIKLDPNYSTAYNNRGVAYNRLRKRKEAREDFKKACDLGEKLGCRNLRN